ncbi:hypothetical protein [Phocoenobacter skyensis]|uniref:hypothetical protein n=1 Tax=Phocoenobacter skyensis TaxID=97481 RepID=UPI00275A1CBF|nr:hypothetical protein [Pasteurella skyensis]MDP8185289.1 hypothetical protein [Pasteurella skyensis]
MFIFETGIYKDIIDFIRINNMSDRGCITEEIADEVKISIQECKNALDYLQQIKLIKVVPLINFETRRLAGRGYVLYEI